MPNARRSAAGVNGRLAALRSLYWSFCQEISIRTSRACKLGHRRAPSTPLFPHRPHDRPGAEPGQSCPAGAGSMPARGAPLEPSAERPAPNGAAPPHHSAPRLPRPRRPSPGRGYSRVLAVPSPSTSGRDRVAAPASLRHGAAASASGSGAAAAGGRAAQAGPARPPRPRSDRRQHLPLRRPGGGSGASAPSRRGQRP